MASRTNTPANPTLQGITDDASRGGLFARSAVANPVSGADINGVAINDSMITIDINGMTQSFTLNQASSDTLTFTVAGGTTPGGGAGGASIFASASFDNNILTLIGNTPQPNITVDLNSFATDAELAALRALIPTNIGDLSDVPSTRGTTGQILAVNSDGDGLTYVDPATASVSASSFSNSGNVTFTADGALVQGDAALLWANGAGVSGTNTFNGIALNPNSNLQFVASGDGVVIQAIPAAPMAMDTPVPPSNAFVPEVPMTMIEISGGTRNGNPTGTLTGPGVSDSNIMISPGGTDTEVEVSFPDSNMLPPGDYEIETTQPITPDVPGGPTSVTSMTPVMRIIPFFQSRTDLTTSAQVLASTASSAAWSNSLTAIAGTGVLYFAVLASELAATSGVVYAMSNTGFPVRYASLREVTVTGSGQTQTYRIFRAPANAGVMLTFS